MKLRKNMRVGVVGLVCALGVGNVMAGPVVFPANGHTYDIVLDNTSSWFAAGSAAASSGGHLATITSPAEQSFIESLLVGSNAPTGSYFFGLRESPPTSGVYKPINGETSTYSNWDAGEPNNGIGVRETVGAILWTRESDANTFVRRGKWNDTLVTGYPDPIVGNSEPADLVRAGYVVEIEPAAVPLPPAVLMAPLAAVMAGAATRRPKRAAD